MVNPIVIFPSTNVQNSNKTTSGSSGVEADNFTTASIKSNFNNYVTNQMILDGYVTNFRLRSLGGIGRGWSSPYAMILNYAPTSVSEDNFTSYPTGSTINTSGSDTNGWMGAYSAIPNYLRLTDADFFESYETSSDLNGVNDGEVGWSGSYRVVGNAIIENTTIANDGTDKKIEISGSTGVASYFARSLHIGTDWKKLRIGCTLSTPYSSSTGPLWFMFMGLCSGTSSVYGDSPVSHSLGIFVRGTATKFNFAGPPPGILYRSQIHSLKASGSNVQTFLSSVTAAQPLCYSNDNSGSYRLILSTEISKISTNVVTCSLFYYGSTNVLPNAAVSDRGTACQVEQSTQNMSQLGYTYNSNVGSFSNFDEATDGPLDSVCINISSSNVDGLKIWLSNLCISKIE